MTRYAAKIGELYIKADRPITDEDRKRVLKHFEKRRDALYFFNDLEITAVVTKD